MSLDPQRGRLNPHRERDWWFTEKRVRLPRWYRAKRASAATQGHTYIYTSLPFNHPVHQRLCDRIRSDGTLDTPQVPLAVPDGLQAVAPGAVVRAATDRCPGLRGLAQQHWHWDSDSDTSNLAGPVVDGSTVAEWLDFWEVNDRATIFEIRDLLRFPKDLSPDTELIALWASILGPTFRYWKGTQGFGLQALAYDRDTCLSMRRAACLVYGMLWAGPGDGRSCDDKRRIRDCLQCHPYRPGFALFGPEPRPPPGQSV